MDGCRTEARFVVVRCYHSTKSCLRRSDETSVEGDKPADARKFPGAKIIHVRSIGWRSGALVGGTLTCHARRSKMNS